MATLYNVIGEHQTADSMSTKMAETAVEYINWERTLTRRQRASVENSVKMQKYMLQIILNDWERNGKHELVDKYYPYIAGNEEY